MWCIYTLWYIYQYTYSNTILHTSSMRNTCGAWNTNQSSAYAGTAGTICTDLSLRRSNIMNHIVLCGASKHENTNRIESWQCNVQLDTGPPVPVQLVIMFKSLTTLHVKVSESQLMHCTMPLKESFLSE